MPLSKGGPVIKIHKGKYKKSERLKTKKVVHGRYIKDIYIYIYIKQIKLIN